MKIKTAILFLFLLSVTFQIHAQHQPGFPATPAGKRAGLFLQMLNSTGDDALKQFITGSMTPNPDLTLEQRIERFRGIRANLGGAKLIKVLKAGDENIEFVIETAKAETKKIMMDIDPEDAGKRLAGFGVQDIDKNAAEKPLEKPLPENEFAPALEKYLDGLVKADKFSGVVLIAKDGKSFFNKACGLADREKKIPNKADTKFNIGSENKIFTQLAIGILADEGKLALGDKLGKYLPDYPNKDAAEKITIEHLLAMKSGIGDFFNREFEVADKSKIRSLKDYLPFFASKPLLFEPGANSRYSNGGYLVLGLIIEKVTGKSYYDFVRERIFKPAGMTGTESYEMDKLPSNTANGYLRPDTGKDAGKLVVNVSEQPARGSSAGGGYSTAEDMLRFANALESGKLPSPKSMKDSPERVIRMISEGIRIAGGSPGVNATFSMKLKGGYTVIVMSNLDPPSAEEVSRQVRIWLGAN